jgi:hypothetical protein
MGLGRGSSLFLAAIMLIAHACSSSSSTSNRIEPCSPGESVPCETASGCSGRKICKTDGKGFGECACADAGSAGSGGSVGGASGNGGVAASSGRSGAGASSGAAGSDASAGASGGVSGVGGGAGTDASVDTSGGANGSAGMGTGGTDAGGECQPAGGTCVTSADCCAPNTCGFSVSLGRSICAALVCQGQACDPNQCKPGGYIPGCQGAIGWRLCGSGWTPICSSSGCSCQCPSGGCSNSSYCTSSCNAQCC